VDSDAREPRDFPTFVELLTLEFIEEDIFRGRCHQGAPLRAFGGQVAAQSLVAAGRTVSEHQVHSLHGYFMRPGDPRRPIVYHVDRIRNGRSFTTRRVTAIQHGEAIFSLSASFQKQEDGVEHQFAMPQVPDPDQLASSIRGRSGSKDAEDAADTDDPDDTGDEGLAKVMRHIVEMKFVDVPWEGIAANGLGLEQRVWLRAVEKLPADPLLHVCALAYLSDLTLAATANLPHHDTQLTQMASLDHAMWFHRPFRADEWLLFVQDSPSASGARGLARGEFYTRDGRLVVSTVQEALMRHKLS
jgi:acyl-CoA thioesterase-2